MPWPTEGTNKPRIVKTELTSHPGVGGRDAMEEQNPASYPVQWLAAVVILAAAIGGVWWLQSPLKSSRPAQEDTEKGAETTSLCEQGPTMRLWEDPFDAVSRYHARCRPTKTTAEEAIKELEPEDGYEDPILVLPVMVTARPFGEDKEWRIRTRVAVHSALAAAGYAPVDDVHIKMLQIAFTGKGSEAPRPRRADQVNSKQGKPLVVLSKWLKMLKAVFKREHGQMESARMTEHADSRNDEHFVIPCEWFKLSETSKLATPPVEHPKGQFKRILVLWLGDKWFGQSPWNRITQLKTELEKRGLRRCGLQYRVIGPWSSNTLRALFAELEKTGGSATCAPPKSLDRKPLKCEKPLTTVDSWMFYSPTATADDNLIYARRPIKPSVHARPRSLFVQRGGERTVGFCNLTCTDSQLAEELVDELALRGVNLEKDDRIAIVAEHDTLYGRALPLSFAHAANRRWSSPSGPDAELDSTLGSPDRKVRCFTYLRGLDGVRADQGQETPDGRRRSPWKGNDDGLRQTEKKPEYPQGNARLDYVRRLTRELQRWDKQQPGKLRAIGVLGSDVYDKLLLLQALRPHFHGVLFFTTGLDARMLDPKELKWTRNLIVASSYGLTLNPGLQRGIPPFRDCYQTATFHAVLKAVEDPAANEPTYGFAGPPARRFEIGFGGAQDISVQPDAINGDPPIHPRRISGTWAREGLMGLGLGALACLMLGLAISQLAPLDSGFWNVVRKQWLAVTVVVALFFVYAGVVAYDHYNRRGAPFSLFEGVSVWPTCMIRLLGILLGIAWLFVSCSKLANLRREIDGTFMLARSQPEPDQKAKRKKHVRRRLTLSGLWAVRRRYSISNWRREEVQPNDHLSTETVGARELWEEYCERGRPHRRWMRVIPETGIYFLALVGIMRILGSPSHPHRGTLNGFMSHFTLMACILVFILVTAYVIDATRLCARLIDLLSRRRTIWPDELLEQSEKTLGLERKYIDEWLDMRLIARLTETVGRLIWGPLIILALLIIARNSYFADFDWPLSLMLVLSLNTAFVVGYAFLLRRIGRKAREVELERLRYECISAEGRASGSGRQIKDLINEIETMNQGAFAPLTSHPVVRAVVATTFAGLSIPAMFEYFGSFGQ
jgi:hypothetical protein